jgi:hypothetical protein
MGGEDGTAFKPLDSPLTYAKAEVEKNMKRRRVGLWILTSGPKTASISCMEVSVSSTVSCSRAACPQGGKIDYNPCKLTIMTVGII